MWSEKNLTSIREEKSEYSSVYTMSNKVENDDETGGLIINQFEVVTLKKVMQYTKYKHRLPQSTLPYKYRVNFSPPSYSYWDLNFHVAKDMFHRSN